MNRLRRAALGFLSLEPREPELRLLHQCFDNWRGIGDVVAGMARVEYDLELRRYNGRGWRAVFFPSGFEHSFTSHAGAAWARAPWEAVQRAANDAFARLDAPEPLRATGQRPTSRRGDGFQTELVLQQPPRRRRRPASQLRLVAVNRAGHNLLTNL